jgi:hypothetical protein
VGWDRLGRFVNIQKVDKLDPKQRIGVECQGLGWQGTPRDGGGSLLT